MMDIARKPKILAVDDEAFNLDIIEYDLQDAGFDVIRADSGKTAFKKLEENGDFDVILLDRMMPEMDGIEVLKVLKADPHYCDIPIIMQTAYAQQEHILEGIKGGVCRYLVKPYTDKLLINALNDAMRTRKHN